MWKLEHPRAYLAAGTAVGIGGAAPLRAADLPVEFLMNALRLVEGVPGCRSSRWSRDCAERGKPVY